MRTAEEKQVIIDKFQKAENKRDFCSAIGIAESGIRRWIRIGPENMRQPRNARKKPPTKKTRNGLNGEYFIQPVKTSQEIGKEILSEIDKLKLENLVLRTNLTMAMKLGYLDFLTMETH